MNMFVRVSEMNIHKGVRKEQEYCPIALALKQKFHKRVLVGSINALVYYRDEPTEYVLPKDAVNFIADYDKGVPVKPFLFKLI
jgi:hypothetical protein